jgi:sulfofructose kinase
MVRRRPLSRYNIRGLKIPVPEGKTFDVVGMGLNAVDDLCVVPHYPSFNSKTRIHALHRQGGGQVATAMVALARWGVRVRYIGKVGDDERGRFSVRSIRQEGVDVSHVTVEPGATSQFAFIIIDARNGERTILWDRDERLRYRKGELSEEAVCSGRILHLDGHDIAATCQAIRWARQVGIPTVMDIDKVEEGTAEMVRDIDFLITSSNFPIRYTGVKDREAALRALGEAVNGFVTITLGREGAMALTEDGPRHFPGFKVRAVDTTGAGDVFHAGFIFGLLKGWDLKQTMAFSNAVAAMKCTQIGGRAGIPKLSAALTFLAEHLPHWQDISTPV